ncbi:hypothetical protein ACH5RR_033637 [Cinchona calisaya]|uniref:DUF4283 domain-containing protein n=1 Tax=Cinchona calisaya TaxID=153742 RepID=A0ABD2Y8J1_9GENT
MESTKETRQPDEPKIQFSEEELLRICKPWKQAVIIKLLDYRLGLNFLATKLQSIWMTQVRIQISQLGEGYFAVRFEHPDDYFTILGGGPRYINDHTCMSRDGNQSSNRKGKIRYYNLVGTTA